MNLVADVSVYRNEPVITWQWQVRRKESKEVLAAGWNINDASVAKAIAKEVKKILLNNSSTIVSL